MLPNANIWCPITDIQSGYLYNLSEYIRIIEGDNKYLFVPVNEGSMIISSDYSGQHKEESHEAYSFLSTSSRLLEKWLPHLEAFRKEWLPDGRRLSFKKLNEPVRWRALPAFLETAGRLNANLITIMVEKRVGSFMIGGPKAAIEVFPDCFPPNAKHGTVEKMLRLASFVALILSGLRNEDQISNWISDHDETLDSQERREQFARLATYLTFGITGWRQPADNYFGTTELDKSPYWAEDVAAISDIAAGAYCKMSRHLPTFMGRETWKLGISSSNIKDHRALAVGNWLATNQNALRHVLLRLEHDSSGEVRASAQSFLGRLGCLLLARNAPPAHVAIWIACRLGDVSYEPKLPFRRLARRFAFR